VDVGLAVEAGVTVGVAGPAGVGVLVAGATGAVLAGFPVSVLGLSQAAKVKKAATTNNSFFMVFSSSKLEIAIVSFRDATDGRVFARFKNSTLSVGE